MSKVRCFPNVNVTDKYLIVLGGLKSEEGKIKELSCMEIFDFEAKCWFSNESLNLPEEKVPGLRWLSACVCGNNLYVATLHSDPEYSSTIKKFIDNLDEEDSNYGDHYDYLDPEDPFPCYSLFRCPLGALRATQDGEMVEVWHKVEYPHHSVYLTPTQHGLTLPVPLNDFLATEKYCGVLEHGELQRPAYSCYFCCHFALSCINDKLIAVGCKHIRSTTYEELREMLRVAYKAYRDAEEYNNERSPSLEAQERNDIETISAECSIYEYCTDSDSWRLVTNTPPNGKSNNPPSVANVDSSLVIMRKSKTVHIVDFP